MVGYKMRQSKYNENEIIRILKKIHSGSPVLKTCKDYEISRDTYYGWKKKYSSILKYFDTIDILEYENKQLKNMFVQISIEKNELLSRNSN